MTKLSLTSKSIMVIMKKINKFELFLLCACVRVCFFKIYCLWLYPKQVKNMYHVQIQISNMLALKFYLSIVHEYTDCDLRS